MTPKAAGHSGRPWPARGRAAGCSGSQGTGQGTPTNGCVRGWFPESKAEEGETVGAERQQEKANSIPATVSAVPGATREVTALTLQGDT